MDPITLLSAGSLLIRTIGGALGGKTKDIADKVADVADAVSGKPKAVQQQQMQAALSQLPPDAMIELQKLTVEVKRINADREKAALEHEEKIYSESQQTIRAQDTGADEYVRRTRPKIARLSAYLGFGYALIMEVLHRIGEFTGHAMAGADSGLLATLLGPVGFYMTMRTVDAFSKHKGSRL